MQLKKLHSNTRTLEHSNTRTLTSLLFCLSTALSVNVLAQDNAAGADEELLTIETIVVTGSRIARKPGDVSAPLVSTNSDDLKFSNSPDLGQLLQELPQISAFGGRTADSANDRGDSGEDTGLSRADLRGLGSNRTLVLVNGKRHVAGAQGTTAVDLSTIPSALVKSVEVITGGASAVYGSDAVTGVVNIILDDEFEGVRLDASYNSRSDNSAGNSKKFSLAYGSELSGGRGHVTASIQHDTTRLLRAADQSFSRNYDDVTLETMPGNGSPDSITLPNVVRDVIGPFGVFGNDIGFRNAAGELITFGSDNPTERYSFNEAGTDFFALPTPISTRGRSAGNFATNAYENVPLGTQPGDDFLTIIPQAERFVFTTSAKYEVSDAVEAYVDFKFVDVGVEDLDLPRQVIFRPIVVADNPFLTDELRQRFQDAGVAEFPILLNVNDAGDSGELVDRRTFQLGGGFRGELDAGFSDLLFDAYVQRGETNNSIIRKAQRVNGNLNGAVDAVTDPETGEAACRSLVPSAQPDGYRNPVTFNPAACAPLNPFGGSSRSAETLAFAFPDVRRTQNVQQTFAGVTFTGDTERFLQLPAGPAAFAGGYEYRREAASQRVAELDLAGLINDNSVNADASYNVHEVFAEISLPILQGLPGVESLTLDTAIRYADYSHAGSATAYKFGGTYAVTDRVSFRGTYSRAVRAPNLTEAFSAQRGQSFNVEDLCDADRVPGEAATVASNCAALGIATDFEAFEALSIRGTVGGNPNLTSETSDSFTAGFVLNPTDSITLSLDYYSIDIEDAISQVGAQDIVNLCLRDANGVNNEFCGLISRNAGPNDGPRGEPVGGILSIASGFVNASAIEAKGIDLAFNYSGDASDVTGGFIDGPLSFNLVYSHLMEHIEFPFQNDPSREDIKDGEIGRPNHQFKSTLIYDAGPFEMRWETLFLGNQVARNLSFEQEDRISPADTGITFYSDYILSKTFDVGNTQLSAYVGINNFFDEAPPIAALSLARRNEAANYDQLGRNFVIGFTANF